MSTTHKRCPFCGQRAEIQAWKYNGKLDGFIYDFKCLHCGCSFTAGYCETEEEAIAKWNHRATDGQQCSGCTWYRISDAFNWCELVHQKRDATDFCSRWEKA